MKIYLNKFESENESKFSRGVALGNFDGIHIGHSKLIQTLVHECRNRNFVSCVYTFENHPNNVIFKDKHTPVIMTVEQKIKITEELGVDELFLERFDEEYAATSPEDFIKNILVEKLSAKLVVVGYDYSYGRFGQGKVEMLIEKGKEYGFEVIVIPQIKKFLPGLEKEVKVSSTVLREFIKNADMENYRALTGRNYAIPGKVAQGRKVGKKLGFPTANILPKAGFALPEFGVYATVTHADGKTYRSITNIGNNPTFKDAESITIETHLIGFKGELYGQDIEVEFIKKMRGEITFSSPDELINQISKDLKDRKDMNDGIQKMYERNGVEIYYVPADKFKTAVIKVMICDNLSHERAYKNSLISAILNSGTKKYPTIKKISEKMQELYGAGLSVGVSSVGEVQTTEIWTEYTEQKYVPNNPRLERDIIDFVFELIFNPDTREYNGKTGFVQETFERERINRDEQIKALINDKNSYANRRCIEVMCENEPYSVSSIGKIGDGDNLTPVSLYEYYKENFLKHSVVKIFYSGKKYPEILTEYTAKFFEDTNRIQINEAYLQKENIKESDVKYVEEAQNITQGKLFMGFRVNTPPLSPEYYASVLCVAILGQGTQSKMFVNIREKNSMAYYAAAYSNRMKGVMLAYCAIDFADKDAAQKLIKEQLDAIRNGEISQDEYVAAVKTLCNDLYSYSDSQSHMLSYYFNQSVMGRITDPSEYAEKIKAVTIEEISKAAKRISLDTVYFLTGEGEQGK
ncbi:MAG: bifunctional riboflavin kinase/FAD synthetase [Ruminococcaceae bacterium]|nr:bifunctional riboflavin kinase/FAD synthetase [Oscillospiraceae bacterium]